LPVNLVVDLVAGDAVAPAPKLLGFVTLELAEIDKNRL
jgi:hypothetical protein